LSRISVAGVETGGDLLAPACLDLILHLLERAFARWRYGDYVVPDVAVLHLQRVALDPDVGAERPGQQPLCTGMFTGVPAGRARNDDLDIPGFSLRRGGSANDFSARASSILL
jgi:hypothetical protein